MTETEMPRHPVVRTAPVVLASGSTGFFLAALGGDYRPEVCAITGGFLLLIAAVVWGIGLVLHAVEGAIARRLNDWAIRSTIQAESFDGTWSEIRTTLHTHGQKLEDLEAFQRRLRDELVKTKMAGKLD